MALLITRLIELGIVLIIIAVVVVIQRIKDHIEFKKWMNYYKENGFYYKGAWYNSHFYRLENGEIKQIND